MPQKIDLTPWSSAGSSAIGLSDKFFDGVPGGSHRADAIEKFNYKEVLASVILHELAHALGARAHSDQEAGADPKGLPNADYNDRIIDGCFKDKLK